MKRRERTRHLIELGGLIQKAELAELTDDDRAMMFGAFLHIAELLQSERRDDVRMLWRRKGKRAFEGE